MKNISVIVFLAVFVSFPAAAEYVRGYCRDDGRCVKGYHRTDANNSIKDNYSTKGNINPYTGKKGTKRTK